MDVHAPIPLMMLLQTIGPVIDSVSNKPLEHKGAANAPVLEPVRTTLVPSALAATLDESVSVAYPDVAKIVRRRH